MEAKERCDDAKPGDKDDSDSDGEWLPAESKPASDDDEDDDKDEPAELADELAALQAALPRAPGDDADDEDATGSLSMRLVSHYLSHVQPIVDDFAAARCSLFADVDDAAELDVETCEHSLERHAAFVEFGARLDREVGAWCAAEGVDEAALARALGAAAKDARAGRETMASLLLTLLAAADDYGAFTSYMAGEAERLDEREPGARK